VKRSRALLGATPLTSDEVGLRGLGWRGETPLGYDVLREASLVESGERLGPVGGRIVAELMIALLERDPISVRFADPEWRPTPSFSICCPPQAAPDTLPRRGGP
jgi:hypothetical protein